MGSPITQQTGTAADLLGYERFFHGTRQAERLTRVATANQEWIVKDWDGENYRVKFDKNFSKKHLFTFSKDVERTKQLAAQKAQSSGKGALENWHDAEIELLKNKIVKNLDKRAVADTCRCGHRFNKHLANNPAPPPPKIPSPCTEVGCGCPRFQTPYALARQFVGKPSHDPVSGATTSRNTCIILNWVPRAEFEEVVVKSIQAYEKPPGWSAGNPLAIAVGGSVHLRWDFGLARKGVILQAQRVGLNVNYTEYQGCSVQAKKIATTVGVQTWEVYHMDSPPF